jgi:hypothetical protein
VDTIYIDPGRRSVSGKKLFIIEDSEPDVLKIQDALLRKANNVLIKLSPMLDISQTMKQLKNVAEVYVISLENECKELLFLLKKHFTPIPIITCVNLSKKNNRSEISFFQLQEKAKSINYTFKIEQYIYEPNTSLLKAGCFKILTDLYPVRKFHADSHLYTSDTFIPDFPGRIFETETCSSFNKKELKDFLSKIDSASITVRNFSLSAVELRKKLKLRDGGNIFLFATTLANNKRVLISCKKRLP